MKFWAVVIANCAAALRVNPSFAHRTPVSRDIQMEASKNAAIEVNVDGNLTALGQEWDAERYQDQYEFVWKFGNSVVDLLQPQPGETILDLGCGTGELTKELVDRGAKAMGIDADPAMIERAQAQFPDLEFMVADARTFEVQEPVDAVFSNAALHWVPQAASCVAAIAQALKPGGRFVAEFGGKGNLRRICDFLERKTGKDKNPWFFPSIAEYASLLEQHGLEVTQASLFDRPTQLSGGEDGLRNWIRMFGGSFIKDLSESDLEALLTEAEDDLREFLHNGNDGWLADYRRIRLVAVKGRK